MRVDDSQPSQGRRGQTSTAAENAGAVENARAAAENSGAAENARAAENTRAEETRATRKGKKARTSLVQKRIVQFSDHWCVDLVRHCRLDICHLVPLGVLPQ